VCESLINIVNSSSFYRTSFHQNIDNFPGNAYGGCFSVYIGSQFIDPSGLVPLTSGPLLVSNFQGSIVGNSFLHSYAGNAGQSTSGYDATSGSNVYGGAIAIVVGHYMYSGGTLTGLNTVQGDLMLLNYSITVNSNTFNGSIASSATYGIGPAGNSYGVNSYGGAVSVFVGCYSYSYYFSRIDGSIMVSSSNFDIRNNAITGSNASSSTGGGGNSYGASVYGGAVSVAIGSYSMAFSYDANQKQSSFSIYNGGVTVTSTSIFILKNIISHSTALSSVGSGASKSSIMFGGMSYGGGISLLIGGYSFVGSLSAYFESDSVNAFNGDTSVQSSDFVVSGNALFACAAKTEVVGSGVAYAGSAQGGGISVQVGSYAYTNSLSGSTGLSVSESFGDILISYSTWLLDNNNIVDCVASTIISQSTNVDVSASSPSDSFATNAYVALCAIFVFFVPC
jgi:hypothetical protein